ncbi:hypothetical protein [Cupriavidus sp. AU9028]|uniref:hypothetical protein n=1 Tax=Cupriavidus sp. AU9028 TaxID=2871157 RepID=UPI002102C677|nr:hypothetical protein [Cupriavidus sp. AU9028]
MPSPPTAPIHHATPSPAAAGTPASPPSADPSPAPPAVVPVGYRQGCITAISVLLAFTLAFWRYWSFESPGPWNALAWTVEVSVAVAAALQSVALFRSLRVEDDLVHEYRRTQQWLLVSAVVLLAGLLAAFAEGLLYD